MPTSSSLHEIQPDMEHIPPSQQQQEREQEQELGGLQQQLLQRQQRIAQLRVKRLSMSTIVDTSSSSFSSTSSSTVRYSSSSSSSSSTSRTASFSLPTSPITGYTASSLGSTSFLENRPTSNSSSSGSNSNNSVFRRHSRRTSSSMSSSSLSDWQHMGYTPSSSSMSSNPAFPAVPGSSITPVPARRQQQQKQQWSTKHQVSQSSELDGPPQLLPFPSRPNSFASSYQPVVLSRKNSQRSSQQQQQRQLDQQGPSSTMTHHSNDSNSANRYEKESNAAFERICSLLTHLITDASTAVSTSENKDADGNDGNGGNGGNGGGLSVIIPRYLPIVCSESENSDNDEVQEQQQQEALDPRGQGGAMDLPINHDDYGGLDGRNLIYDEEHHQIPESPRDQIRRRIDDSRKKRWARTRSGSYITSPSKRTSLFLELQNLQMEEQPMGEQHSTTPVLNHHHRHLDSGFESLGKLRQLQDFGPMDHGTLSPVFGSFSAGRTLDSLATTTTTADFSPATPSRSLDFELFDSELGSPITLTPRRRASFPPRRSDRVQLQRAEELQRVIQRVDAELDRTVETIDDLTRDLVAVATHQNWMKTHLERTLGLYSPLSLTDFIEKDDATFQAEAVEGAGAGAGVATPISSTIPRDRLEQMEDIIGATKALLSSKEFANYYKVLERVRVIEEDEYDDYERDGDDGDVFGGRSDIDAKHHQQQQQQRLSGSSYTLANSSFRHSASSTLSLETRFGSYADFKDGALLTSNSSRPSIEWSDRIGAPYHNNNLSLSQDRIHPLVAAPAFLDPQEQQELASPLMPTLIKNLELEVEQPAKQETNRQEQRATTFDTFLHQTALEGDEDILSPDAALAIDKLILACTHLSLLLFWTLALFLGVVITDGSILENAGRQLISSVGILQSHFTVPKDVQDDNNDKDNTLDDDTPSFSSALQEQEQEQGSAPTPKSTRPSHPSSTRRRRTRPSSQQRHQHHHLFLRRRLSSLLPQINAPAEGGSSFTSTLGVGRFYNSPFLASSRYQVDISSKEPKAIQLGPGPGPSTAVPSASAATSAATMSSTPVTAPVPPASLSSSCSSTTGLQDQDSMSSSISTASSSATLLDWLDSTTAIHSVANGQKMEVQAFTKIDTNTINNNNNDGRLSYESHH